MTTVQELSVLHRRYADISHRFRAAWTFHQFVQSLAKTLLQRVEDPHSTEFQNLYNGLKEISQNLNASESEKIRHRLEAIDRRLTELILALDEEDTKVTPDLLRQFFRRVKNYDDKILSQLVRFYLYAHPGGPWPTDRLDKVDFLLARLSEEVDERTGELVLRDHQRLTEIFQGIWAQLGESPPSDQSVEERQTQIAAVRLQMSETASLDGLNEANLIRRYRELKHGMGNLYFHPELLLDIQETNLVFKSRVQKLYRQEEQRIIAEYQRVFELEREVPFDTQLDRELAAFREEIERFEKQLQKEEFRLGDIAQIRQKVRELLPRLNAVRTPTMDRPSVSRMAKDTGEFRLDQAAVAAASSHQAHEELLGEHYRRLVDTLREINPPDLAPERVVLRPEVFALRVEPREVEAYRRVFGKESGDRELEQFLLDAAALRVRINEEAQEIASLLDETSVTGDAVVFARARLTCRAADGFLWRFQHVLNELLMAGDMAECRQVQLLRIRLMRDYSGLWLLAFKPLYKRHPVGTFA
ncbi:MAG TPA: hypothetical protein VF789_10570 [Thermoanaerobaculia bacterium]